MPQGLQCFDENGNLILDVTDRLVKYIGTGFIDLNVTEGEIVNSEITEKGDLWYVLIKGTGNSRGADPRWENIFAEFPILTKENGKIKWRYTQAARRGGTIMYGVY